MTTFDFPDAGVSLQFSVVSVLTPPGVAAQDNSGTGSLNQGDSNCVFEYVPRWQDFMELLFPEFKDDPKGDIAQRINQAVAILEERDHQLEDHLANRPCCDCDEGGGG